MSGTNLDLNVEKFVNPDTSLIKNSNYSINVNMKLPNLKIKCNSHNKLRTDH